MDYNLLFLVGVVIVPIIILLLFRINAAMIFLSLCMGYVLTQFLGSSARSLVTTFMPHASITTSALRLILLLFPAVFTAFFMVRSVRGSRAIINILPSLSVGCLLVLLVVPLLPPATYNAITHTILWQQAIRLQDLIIGAGALASLFTLWLLKPRHKSEKSR